MRSMRSTQEGAKREFYAAAAASKQEADRLEARSRGRARAARTRQQTLEENISSQDQKLIDLEQARMRDSAAKTQTMAEHEERLGAHETEIGVHRGALLKSGDEIRAAH